MAGGYTSEVKFVLEASAGREIAAWVREHLFADEHGTGSNGDEYRVTTLYLDTPSADVFHRRGSHGRSKYRVRRYQDERTVFLERKLRTARLLSKRRTQIALETLGHLAERSADDAAAARWFARRVDLRDLRPVCQVSYLRIARHARTSDGLARLTLDGGVTALPNPAWTFVDGSGTELLREHAILEIKYRSHVPAVFRQLVERFRLNPRQASKYRLAANALGVVGVHA